MSVEKTCECVNSKKNINPELKDMIDRIAKKEGFTNYKLDIKNVTPDGNNYLGLLTEVTVHNVDSKEDLHLFVKSMLPGAEQIEIISVPEAYRIEVFLYLELSKVLENFQIDANIPIDERYKFVKSYDESTMEHIIMENMAKKGFTSTNRYDIISLDFAEKAVKLLAKFHSLGFVLQDRKPKFFEEKIMPLKFPVKFDEEHQKFFFKMAEQCISYTEGDVRSKLENVLKPLYAKTEGYVRDRDSTITISHGDFRSNNILVKISEGEIIDMIPVDYQIINYGSPVLDLIYFIFGATDREFRRKHLDYLKNLYYETMKQFFKYFDMNVQKYYPKEEYERLFKERLDYGLYVGLWYIPLNLASEENIVDLSKSQFSDADFGTNDLAKTRIQELVDEFIEWGYL